MRYTLQRMRLLDMGIDLPELSHGASPKDLIAKGTVYTEKLFKNDIAPVDECRALAIAQTTFYTSDSRFLTTL